MKTLSRRDFLKLGGAALVVVAGGSVFRAVDQGMFSVGQGIAYEPWKNWRDAASPAERIVAAGILASNPHNSQPWLFRITASTIDLFAVPERQIGVIDPFRREMYIGLGCAIENMRLAAEAEGFKADIRLMPDPTTESHAASISLAESSPALPLPPPRSTKRFPTVTPTAPPTTPPAPLQKKFSAESIHSSQNQPSACFGSKTNLPAQNLDKLPSPPPKP